MRSRGKISDHVTCELMPKSRRAPQAEKIALLRPRWRTALDVLEALKDD